MSNFFCRASGLITIQKGKNMTQQIFPEVQAAAEALERQIAATEAEIAEMKEAIASKKHLVRAWRKAVSAVAPQQAPRNKRAAAN
jgi:hypothetical protein